MLAATLLAATAMMPLGVWPTQTGEAAITVHGVEFYLVEPEDDYSIIAVQPLTTPLRKAEAAEVERLAAIATRLGADAVLLLGEMSEKAIPKDPQDPLPSTGRFSVAVFLSFDEAEGWEAKPAVPSGEHRRIHQASPHPATAGPCEAARASAGTR